MAKPEWGTKRICQSCGVKFYDFNRAPIVCPACKAEFDPEALLKSRRARPAAVKAPKPEPRPAAGEEEEDILEIEDDEVEIESDLDEDEDFLEPGDELEEGVSDVRVGREDEDQV